MRLRQVVVLAALLVAAAAMAGGARAATSDPFTGVWIGVESPIGDGSTDVMAIGTPRADGTRTWLYYETNASGFCGGGPLSAAGTTTSAGSVLTATVTGTHCFNGSPGTIARPFDITMSATGDGHVDWAGVIFSRLGKLGPQEPQSVRPPPARIGTGGGRS
jgi:hypothetical protein